MCPASIGTSLSNCSMKPMRPAPIPRRPAATSTSKSASPDVRQGDAQSNGETLPMTKAFLFLVALGATVAVVTAACADPLDPKAEAFAAAAAKATPLYTLSYPQARNVLEIIQAG